MILLLTMLSVSIIEVEVMLMRMLLHNAICIRKEIETETDDKNILDSIKEFMTSSNVKCGRIQKIAY